ncbi:uncharacterized protein LOC133532071 [Cydia pomonella]|uniref:uncharacterized protein LOC133532071 n=1 Tax=Cydia pomonella TaxID=82600 RepID=UPI002ADE0CDB|nr:uncharacterized protein LOC133532071 [Cydia pomonella]
MSPISIFALCISCLIQVNYCSARRTYTVINGPAVYASNLVYIPTIRDQSCVYGSSYSLPVSYDSYSLNDCSISYPSISCCSCPSYSITSCNPSACTCSCPSYSIASCFPSASSSSSSSYSITSSRPCESSSSCPSYSITSSIPCESSSSCNTPSSLGPDGSYGGIGSGEVSITGTVEACGTTCVSGSVPVLGSASFSGCTPACGSVSIKGQCECDC